VPPEGQPLNWRLYNLSGDNEGRLRIVDRDAHPRRWQLIEGMLGSHLILGLVIGHDTDGRILIEEMTGRRAGYPTGRKLWDRGTDADRQHSGLPTVGTWWKDFERAAARDAPRPVGTAMIDGELSRIIALSGDLRYIVTAPLNDLDRAELAAWHAREAAHIVVTNSEIASRYSELRNIPVPDTAERLPLFGGRITWDILVPAEDTPDAILNGHKLEPRPYEPVQLYRTNAYLTAYIWRAGPRGGRLIGYEYRRSGTIAGTVPWTGKRDQALRLLSGEYEQAYWLEYTNGIGGD
jgi:hypothetical protein